MGCGEYCGIFYPIVGVLRSQIIVFTSYSHRITSGPSLVLPNCPIHFQLLKRVMFQSGNRVTWGTLCTYYNSISTQIRWCLMSSCVCFSCINMIASNLPKLGDDHPICEDISATDGRLAIALIEGEYCNQRCRKLSLCL